MSIHGNQYILPFFMRKNKDLPPINDNDELTLAFYLITKSLKEEEKVLSFSRLLWPFLSIQGVISTHILLDGLFLFNKRGKLTNPPRQPVIGHVLRNVDNRTKIEQLNKVIDVLMYKDVDAEEIGAGEESEYQTLMVDALVDPQFIQTLEKLIPYIENKPVIDYMPLDTSLTSDKALNISEKYRNSIELMKGNSLRWDTVSELIGEEVNKWITDLVVTTKDIDERFSSQINKTSSTIDSTQVENKLKLEYDKIDQWKVSEKKRVIENMSLLFKTANRALEEIIKKNRFFCNEASLKTRVFEDLLPSLESQFNFLKEKTKAFLDTLEGLQQTYEEYKREGSRLDSEAVVKLEELEASLNIKLKDRDQQLSNYEMEKTSNISDLVNLREQIESLFRKSYDIIQSKKKSCSGEAEELLNWAIKDSQSELFSKPLQWIYLPIYAMFIEDEDMMEERMEVVFPGYIGNDVNSLYTSTRAFNDLKAMLIEKIEEDMKIRSNFEFSCENKNLLDDPNLNKKIIKGISILRSKNLTNGEIENSIREYIKTILQ